MFNKNKKVHVYLGVMPEEVFALANKKLGEDPKSYGALIIGRDDTAKNEFLEKNLAHFGINDQNRANRIATTAAKELEKGPLPKLACAIKQETSKIKLDNRRPKEAKTKMMDYSTVGSDGFCQDSKLAVVKIGEKEEIDSIFVQAPEMGFQSQSCLDFLNANMKAIFQQLPKGTEVEIHSYAGGGAVSTEVKPGDIREVKQVLSVRVWPEEEKGNFYGKVSLVTYDGETVFYQSSTEKNHFTAQEKAHFAMILMGESLKGNEIDDLFKTYDPTFDYYSNVLSKEPEHIRLKSEEDKALALVFEGMEKKDYEDIETQIIEGKDVEEAKIAEHAGTKISILQERLLKLYGNEKQLMYRMIEKASEISKIQTKEEYRNGLNQDGLAKELIKPKKEQEELNTKLTQVKSDIKRVKDQIEHLEKIKGTPSKLVEAYQTAHGKRLEYEHNHFAMMQKEIMADFRSSMIAGKESGHKEGIAKAILRVIRDSYNTFLMGKKEKAKYYQNKELEDFIYDKSVELEKQIKEKGGCSAATSFFQGDVVKGAFDTFGVESANMEDDNFHRLYNEWSHKGHVQRRNCKMFRTICDPREVPSKFKEGVNTWLKEEGGPSFTADKYLDALAWGLTGDDRALSQSAEWVVGKNVDSKDYVGIKPSTYNEVDEVYQQGESCMLDPFWKEIANDFLGEVSGCYAEKLKADLSKEENDEIEKLTFKDENGKEFKGVKGLASIDLKDIDKLDEVFKTAQLSPETKTEVKEGIKEIIKFQDKVKQIKSDFYKENPTKANPKYGWKPGDADKAFHSFVKNKIKGELKEPLEKVLGLLGLKRNDGKFDVFIKARSWVNGLIFKLSDFLNGIVMGTNFDRMLYSLSNRSALDKNATAFLGLPPPSIEQKKDIEKLKGKVETKSSGGISRRLEIEEQKEKKETELPEIKKGQNGKPKETKPTEETPKIMPPTETAKQKEKDAAPTCKPPSTSTGIDTAPHQLVTAEGKAIVYQNAGMTLKDELLLAYKNGTQVHVIANHLFEHFEEEFSKETIHLYLQELFNKTLTEDEVT